ncbi:MAG: hypothetical protein K2K24_04545, partial [Clostridia bacterium]|nr:hypothetical protein [Clostridia bacterium]
YYPEPELGTGHLYGKYTNLTIKNKYFVSYFVVGKINDISVSVIARKLSYQSSYDEPESPSMTPEEVELYTYKEYVYGDITYYYRYINHENSEIYEKNILSLYFDNGDFHYSISVSSLTAEKEELINTIKLIWGDLI